MGQVPTAGGKVKSIEITSLQGMLSLTMRPDHHTPLVAGEFYHLFNRANTQSDKLFYQERNYYYFLEKWNNYSGECFEVWSYCLIPNHIHFLVRVRADLKINPMESWRRMSIAYTQAINKQETRRGSLFQEHPKHLHVNAESHLLSLIRYIHYNPVHHGLTNRPEDWRFSSYGALRSNAKTRVERSQVLALFGGKSAFEDFHQRDMNSKSIAYCLVE